ncbi:hypothetical protein E2C01_048874 [Portunus trituberculatus]|uniref:Uncharacterized protein n=1 Tax=Portunus trituberculatus TaxID=210409 RepID=A0A5B7GC72_PORTR|nr:hypothetical protein [Portunus trituberculatus]
MDLEVSPEYTHESSVFSHNNGTNFLLSINTTFPDLTYTFRKLPCRDTESVEGQTALLTLLPPPPTLPHPAASTARFRPTADSRITSGCKGLSASPGTRLSLAWLDPHSVSGFPLTGRI